MAADLDARLDGFGSIADAALRYDFVGGVSNLFVGSSNAAGGAVGLRATRSVVHQA
jgi:hypothetical protein